MGKTLFDCTYELARALGVVSEGVATGGSTTTIIDTVERTEADDFYNGGTAWIIYDSAGAPPQGEYSFITDQALSSNTLTLRTTLTAAVASGDRYAVAIRRYPLQLLIQKINEALSEIPVEKVDTTTITIAADQTEYSLPSDVWQLKEVWLQTVTDDSNDNRWDRIYDFEVNKSATGTANVLHLNRQFDTDAELKLVYLTYHQTLRNPSDKLDDSIHTNRVIYNAAVGCLLWRKSKVGESDATVNEMLNYFQALAGQMNAQFATPLPKRSAKTFHITFDRP